MKQSQTQEMFDNSKLSKALALYKKNSQDPKAVWIMHYYYENGWCDITVDKSKANTCLKIAASQGHAGASYKLLVNCMFTQDGLDAAELVCKYTSKDHIQKCIDKIDEYDDPPYYQQQQYIELLKAFNEQPKTQINSNQFHSNLIRRKASPSP